MSSAHSAVKTINNYRFIRRPARPIPMKYPERHRHHLFTHAFLIGSNIHFLYYFNDFVTLSPVPADLLTQYRRPSAPV